MVNVPEADSFHAGFAIYIQKLMHLKTILGSKTKASQELKAITPLKPAHRSMFQKLSNNKILESYPEGWNDMKMTYVRRPATTLNIGEDEEHENEKWEIQEGKRRCGMHGIYRTKPKAVKNKRFNISLMSHKRECKKPEGVKQGM